MSLASSSSFPAFEARDGVSSTVSEPLLPGQLTPKEDFDPALAPTQKTGKRFIIYLTLLGAVIAVVILAVALPIYFVVIKPKLHVDAASAKGSSGTSSGGGNSGSGGSGGVTVSFIVLSRFFVSNVSFVLSMAKMDLQL